MDGKTFVYTYREDGLIRYVGITNDPNRRHRQHLAAACPDGSVKDRWFHDLLSSGKEPEMSIEFELDSREKATLTEKRMIATHTKTLVNSACRARLRTPLNRVEAHYAS